MSLTSIISQPNIHNGFKKFVKRSKLNLNKPLIAPPLTNNYSTVGTAFDYLFRFSTQRLNPKTQTRHWVAEMGLAFLRGEDSSLAKIAEKRFEEARQNHKLFLENGIVTDELIASSIYLAYLDVVVRAGSGKVFIENFQTNNRLDIEDLKNLVTIIPNDIFKTEIACFLNPTFGFASALVGGADADIIFDDKIIDIKTTKNFRLESKWIYQILGYYILLTLGGINSNNSKMAIDYLNEISEINSFGIYYSRHAFLFELKITDLIDKKELPNFIKWFVDSACENEEKKLNYCKDFFWKL